MGRSGRAVLAQMPTLARSLEEEVAMSSLSLESGEGPTLEVRWIIPGSLTTSMIEWLGPFSGEIESREDVYLVSRRVRGLSLKIRGGARLDVKVAGGDRRILDVPGRAQGKLGSWQKWSFPLSPLLAMGIESPGWIRVGKIRRIRLFALADADSVARADAENDETSCAVELTDVSIGNERWWTVGFEATGLPKAARRAIDTAAALVFSDPLPNGRKLVAADSMSYTDWLRNRRFG